MQSDLYNLLILSAVVNWNEPFIHQPLSLSLSHSITISFDLPFSLNLSIFVYYVLFLEDCLLKVGCKTFLILMEYVTVTIPKLFSKAHLYYSRFTGVLLDAQLKKHTAKWEFRTSLAIHVICCTDYSLKIVLVFVIYHLLDPLRIRLININLSHFNRFYKNAK